jgi:dihydrofolate reductase
MKKILYMAITVNGMIAGRDDDTSFVSVNEWKSFKAMAKKTGNLIIGRKTYDVMHAGAEFTMLSKLNVVVVSNHLTRTKAATSVQFVDSPEKALSALAEQGFKTVMIAGGGKLNAAFMQKGLIDEIYLDVMPSVLGQGIPLFREAAFSSKLKLLGIKKLARDEIQLHYKVIH